MEVLDNFIELTGCARTWTMEQFIPDTEERIRQQVGDRNVFLLVSGGVDSSVCFALITRALGEDRVIGLHVDNGFMRSTSPRWLKRPCPKQVFTILSAWTRRRRFFHALRDSVILNRNGR